MIESKANLVGGESVAPYHAVLTEEIAMTAWSQCGGLLGNFTNTVEASDVS